MRFQSASKQQNGMLLVIGFQTFLLYTSHRELAIDKLSILSLAHSLMVIFQNEN